jgi:hypothetical protein
MDRGSSEGLKYEAPASEQQDGPASKRPRTESHDILWQQASNENYDAEADEDDVRTEVTTGDGKTHKHTLPPTATVLVLKQHLAHDARFKPGQNRMFVRRNDDSREEELKHEERLGSLRREKGQAVMITMMLEEADAQDVLPRLAAEAGMVLATPLVRISAPTMAWINPTSLDEAIEKFHAEPDRGKSHRQHGRYYINKNEIKKAGRSPSHALNSIWWVGCEGLSQYIPPTEEQIRSW